MSLKFSVLLALAALAPLAPAVAADYEPPVYAVDTPEYVPVEVGSGWYLRGDVGYAFNNAYREDVFGLTPGDTFSRRDLPFSGSVGMGYHFNDFLRAEFNLGIEPSQKSSLFALGTDGTGDYAISASARKRMYSGLFNLDGDLGTYAGFTPYIGAGIGLVSTSREYNFSQTYPLVPGANNSLVDSKRRFDYAYTLGAGVSYNFNQNMAIDLGYQYFSAPNSEYFALTGPATYALQKGISFHKIKVGLRYDLW